MSSLAFAVVQVPVKNLLKIVNPFTNPPWYCKPFSVDDVLKAVEEERFQEAPTPNWYSREDHIERIAYFVSEGWDEDDYTPEINVGIPGEVYEDDWILCDGNHRFAAAVVRGDKLFSTYVSGDLDYAERLLGLEIPDELRNCED